MKCNDCHFHEKIDLHFGKCRRHAPNPTTTPTGGFWPQVVSKDDWCGEGDPKSVYVEGEKK